MEQAIVFGKYDHLLGVENIVFSPPEIKKNIAMILVTPGMLHSVGPFRMYVDVARKLSEMGVSSLRFDLSGIGESLGVGIGGESIDRAATETIEAMDYLSAKHNIKEFILFGLCSGADDSFHTALKDDRVKGVIALDGAGYKTSKFKLNRLLSLAQSSLKMNKWKNKFNDYFSNDPEPASLSMGDDVREFQNTAELATMSFQKLINRGTHLHFIYTGGIDYYNYADQFYDMLPNVNWKKTESTVFFPHLDHVAILCEDREELVENISQKMLEMINNN